jgi:hypothetical protein
MQTNRKVEKIFSKIDRLAKIKYVGWTEKQTDRQTEKCRGID